MTKEEKEALEVRRVMDRMLSKVEGVVSGLAKHEQRSKERLEQEAERRREKVQREAARKREMHDREVGLSIHSRVSDPVGVLGARSGLSLPGVRPCVTPGCQTGCHQLNRVLTHNNNVVKCYLGNPIARLSARRRRWSATSSRWGCKQAESS
jgi:hypothetical protein